MLVRTFLCALILVGLCGTGAAHAGRLPVEKSPEQALLAAIFQAPAGAPAPAPDTGSCNAFKWDRSCSGSSQQECQSDCGTCGVCLTVVQFYPCVYECSCSC